MGRNGRQATLTKATPFQPGCSHALGGCRYTRPRLTFGKVCAAGNDPATRSAKMRHDRHCWKATAVKLRAEQAGQPPLTALMIWQEQISKPSLINPSIFN